MSVRLLESFDYATTVFLPFSQQWDSYAGVTIGLNEGASGFVGDNAAFFDSSLNPILLKAISPVSHNGVYTATLGIRLRPVTLTNKATIGSIRTPLSRFDLKMTVWGSLEVWQTSGGVELGLVCETADGLVPIGTGGLYVEFQITFDAALPDPVKVRVSDQYGEMNAAAEGFFFALTPGELPSTQLVLGGGVGEGPATWWADDVYLSDGVPAATPLNYKGDNIDNSGYLGNTHLTTFYMTADGATQTVGNVPWVPVGAATVQGTISEHPPDEDVTYSSANEELQRSTGLYLSPQSNPFGRQGCCAYAPIYAILWLGRIRVDAGSAMVVPVIRRLVGGTFATDLISTGLTITVASVTYLYYPQILERDPTNDNKPFTFAVFFPVGVGIPGTVEFGIQKVG